MAAAVLIAVTIGVGAMLADQRFLVPQQDPGGPFYARIEYGLIHHTDEWAAVAFYRERGCVPAAFNLLNFFDLTEAFPAGPPRPFLCPLTVHGFVVYEDMAPGAPPIQSKLQGNGAVTVIFVPWEALEAATSDNELFLPELLALPHVTGIATFFEETLHPAGGARQVMLELNAFGLLEDGRSFDYQVTEVKGDLVHVRIVFK
jgi:hypothetical protein